MHMHLCWSVIPTSVVTVNLTGMIASFGIEKDIRKRIIKETLRISGVGKCISSASLIFDAMTAQSLERLS